MSDQDRAAQWDETSKLDSVLGERGGVGVWVFNDPPGDNVGPRACVRKGPTDEAEAAILLGQLILGVDRVIAGIAAANGWDADLLRRMAGDAASMLEDKLSCATRIRPGKDQS